MLNLGLDDASEWTEELRVEDIGGGHIMVFRPPTTDQIAGAQLEMVGKRRNEGAVRDLLDAIILTRDEVDALAYAEDAETFERFVQDERYAEIVDSGKLVDLEFILERLKNPAYNFGQEDFNRFVRYLLEQRTGFPTKPQLASSSGRTTTGRSSTANSRRAGSTRAPSRRAVSST